MVVDITSISETMLLIMTSGVLASMPISPAAGPLALQVSISSIVMLTELEPPGTIRARRVNGRGGHHRTTDGGDGSGEGITISTSH